MNILENPLIYFRVLIIDPDPASTKYLAYELTKAGFEVFSSNIAKEGLILAYQNRPHVIIIDPNIKGLPLNELITKLRKDHRVSRSKIIAFSSLTNPDEIQNAINAGFFHYLNKEGDALPFLIEKTNEAAQLARSGTSPLKHSSKPSDPTTSPLKALGKTFVFLSAKGGIGTSSICANIAHLSNINNTLKVALVDLVLPIGSLSHILGYSGPLNIIEAANMTTAEATQEYLSQALPKPDNWNVQLMAGSPSAELANELDVSRIPVIIDTLKRFYDYVFIDLGKSLSRISMPIITSADQVVLTLSLDPATVALTKSVWEFLKDQGIRNDQSYFIINRAVGLEGLPKSEVESQLEIIIPIAVPYMGGDFTLANNLNQPLATKFPQDAVTISLRQASQEIITRSMKDRNPTDFF